jgi:hypothetical protein
MCNTHILQPNTKLHLVTINMGLPTLHELALLCAFYIASLFLQYFNQKYNLAIALFSLELIRFILKNVLKLEYIIVILRSLNRTLLNDS